MQLNKIMYIDLASPPAKNYAPKKGEEVNRSTYSTMRYNINVCKFFWHFFTQKNSLKMT